MKRVKQGTAGMVITSRIALAQSRLITTRPYNFHPLMLVQRLAGTSKTVQECLPEGMKEKDLLKQDILYVHSHIFYCEGCKRWQNAFKEIEGQCDNCYLL